MLAQLTYVSIRNASCTEAEIQKILSSCKKNNVGLDITGVLLYSDSKFIQMVEGNGKTIGDLYEKIKLDSRHSSVYMISYGPIKERTFPSWHMGVRKIAGSLVDFKTDITAEDQAVFANILNAKEESGVRIVGLLKKFF